VSSLLLGVGAALAFSLGSGTNVNTPSLPGGDAPPNPHDNTPSSFDFLFHSDPHDNDTILPAHHISTLSSRAPSSLPPPFADVNWRDYNIPFTPPIQLPNPNTTSTTTHRLIPGTDFEWLCAMDGAFQGNTKAEGYRNAGAAFICHNFAQKETWFAANSLLTKNSNSAPVSEAEATLMQLEFLVSHKAKSALFIHDNFDMHGFISGIRESRKKGARYDILKQKIIDLLGKFDVIWCIHVHSHQGAKNLAENTAADQLAGLMRKKPSFISLPPTKFDSSISTKQNIIKALDGKLPGNDPLLLDMNFPFLSNDREFRCELCGCPSHCQSHCFLRTQNPKRSTYTKIKPARKAAFCESFADPENIDWNTAPTKLDNHSFVLFISTMCALATRPDSILQAWDALLKLREHYYYSIVRRCLIRKRPHPLSSVDDPNPDANFSTKLAEATARKLHSFAKIE
jgi:hypothetical protein